MTSPKNDAGASLPSGSQVWVVDQVGEQSASVEVDGASAAMVPLWILPKGVQEGDVLKVDRDWQTDRSVVTITRDDEEMRRRLAASSKQVAVTSKNDTSGNIVL